jgi:hypothetical protein
MEMVRDTGKILQIATFGDPVELNLDTFRKKAIQYLFPRGPSDKMWAYTVGRWREEGQSETHHQKILRGLGLQEAVIEGRKGKFNLINPLRWSSNRLNYAGETETDRGQFKLSC